MQKATTIVLAIVRVTGVTQVVLGLLFWANRALSLVPLHMLIGLAFVLALWGLAGLAARAGVHRGVVTGAVLWGAVVLALGMFQGRLLPGPAHWVVEVLHLLVGVAAMVLGVRLAALARRHARDVRPSSAPSDGSPPSLGADDGALA